MYNQLKHIKLCKNRRGIEEDVCVIKSVYDGNVDNTSDGTGFGQVWLFLHVRLHILMAFRVNTAKNFHLVQNIEIKNR